MMHSTVMRRSVLSVSALSLFAVFSLVHCDSGDSDGTPKTVVSQGGSGSGGSSGAGGSGGVGQAGTSGQSQQGGSGGSATGGSAGNAGAAGSIGGSGGSSASAGSAGTAGSNAGTAGSAGSGGQPTATVSILSPNDGANVQNPVSFSMSANNVTSVALVADDMYMLPITWDPTSTSNYQFDYSFSQAGLRTIELRGFVSGQADPAATDSIIITVVDPTMTLCDSVANASFEPPTVCDGPSGNTSTEIPSNYYFSTSWFGCYESNGTIIQDPSDNCEFACGNQGLCDSSLSGPECEATLKWFAADADRFGCGSRIRLTNCENGKQVVLVTLDRGPNCGIEMDYGAAVIDMSHDAMVYLFDGVTHGGSDHAGVVVEEVDSSTPLGPVSP